MTADLDGFRRSRPLSVGRFLRFGGLLVNLFGLSQIVRRAQSYMSRPFLVVRRHAEAQQVRRPFKQVFAKDGIQTNARLSNHAERHRR
jgi:hypothetical protein